MTSTVHKTLGGPRGGFILCRQELAKKIDSAVFPGQQGGPLEHVIAAKAVTFLIAAGPEFVERQRRTLDGAARLAERLTRAGAGVRVLTGGTDVHLVLVDLRESELDGVGAERRLHEVGITVNRNAVPFDPRPPAISSGLLRAQATSPTAATPGTEVSPAASVRTPPDSPSPEPISQSVAGRQPTPRSTRSAGRTEPSVSSTAVTCRRPRSCATPTPTLSSTPCSACRPAQTAPISAPSGPASGTGSISTTVTWTPKATAVLATSDPMKPAPTTTSRAPGRNCWRSARASPGVRSVCTPVVAGTPGSVRGTGRWR